MICLKPGEALVLAVQPNGHGMGWMTFANPQTPYRWGLVRAPRDKNATCMRRFEELLVRFEPNTLILEAFENSTPTRSARVIRLCRSMATLAADRGIEVAIYSHGQVLACFSSVGAQSRHDVAQAIARRFDVLKSRLPRRRRRWETWDHRMAIFTAAALIVAHFTLDASHTFDSLIG